MALSMVMLLPALPALPTVSLASSSSPSAAALAPFGLGQFDHFPEEGDGRCPEYGSTCTRIAVSGCPGVTESRGGFIAVDKATGPVRGMVVLFSGGGGTYYWGNGDSRSESLLTRLREGGIEVVRVRWNRAWEAAAPGEDAGPAHVACRPATAASWIHDNLYADLEVSGNGVGVCGFCIAGASGGSAQAAYPLSHFGLDQILDAVVLIGGPTHAAITKGCLRRQGVGEDNYWYSGPATRQIDSPFGFVGEDGPCKKSDPTYMLPPDGDVESWIERWDQEAVDTQGSDYDHPETRVQFLIGEKDRGMQAHGGDYRDRLVAAGSPLVDFYIVPGMTHELIPSPEGIAALEATLLQEHSGPYEPLPPPPSLSVSDIGVAEGDTGTQEAIFTVTLSKAVDEAVTVDYATADRTATAPDDYVSTNGTLTFAPGATTGEVVVTVNGDTAPEPDETFFVDLSNPSANVTLAKLQGTGTIIDDDDIIDPPPPSSVVTNGDFELGLDHWAGANAEPVSTPLPTHGGSGAARLGGSNGLDSGLRQDIDVPAGANLELWVNVQGAETDGSDVLYVQMRVGRIYETVATVTSAGSRTWQRVSADLSEYGGTRRTLRLLSFNNAEIPTMFYVDDVVVGEGNPAPALPSLSIADTSVVEGDLEPSNATFTATLSEASSETVTVDYATTNGTAVAPGDYVSTNGTLTFAPGATTGEVVVTVNGDTAPEPDETFFVDLSNSSANATVADARGTGTIIDDDDIIDPPPPSSVVTNGDFESGLDGWSRKNAGLVSSPTNGGTGAARLGGSDGLQSGLQQDIDVPAGANLELWVNVQGDETDGGDVLYVQMRVGRIYETVATVTSAGPHTWQRVSADLSEYGGVRRNLRLLSFNNAQIPTTFYVDDVVVG